MTVIIFLSYALLSAPTYMPRKGWFFFHLLHLAILCAGEGSWTKSPLSSVLSHIQDLIAIIKYLLFLSFPAFSFIFPVVCLENNTCSELLLASHLCSQNKQKIICSSRVCPRKAEKVCSSLSTLLLLKGSMANFSTLAVLHEAAPVSFGIKMSG